MRNPKPFTLFDLMRRHFKCSPSELEGQMREYDDQADLNRMLAGFFRTPNSIIQQPCWEQEYLGINYNVPSENVSVKSNIQPRYPHFCVVLRAIPKSPQDFPFFPLIYNMPFESLQLIDIVFC